MWAGLRGKSSAELCQASRAAGSFAHVVRSILHGISQNVIKAVTQIDQNVVLSIDAVWPERAFTADTVWPTRAAKFC